MYPEQLLETHEWVHVAPFLVHCCSRLPTRPLQQPDTYG